MRKVTETSRDRQYHERSIKCDYVRCDNVITRYDDGSFTLGAEFSRNGEILHSIECGECAEEFAKRRDAHWKGFCENMGVAELCGKTDIVSTTNIEDDEIVAEVRWIHATSKERNEDWRLQVRIFQRELDKDMRELKRENGFDSRATIQSEGCLINDDGRVDSVNYPYCPKSHQISKKAILEDIASSIYYVRHRHMEDSKIDPRYKHMSCTYELGSVAYVQERWVADDREMYDTPDAVEMLVAHVNVSMKKKEVEA